MSEELTDDALAGHFRIWQRRRGHRYSLDDVATAWEAVRARPRARRCLDLGCGIGSVLIMIAYKLAEAEVVGVEAQEISIGLARDNVRRNGLADRVSLLCADLRDGALVERLGAASFDLVSGTPPYMPPARGTMPPDPQRAHARMELRGGVEDYLRAAGAFVAPGGRVVVCADARTPERALTGARHAGLVPLARRDVVPRAGRKGPLFSLWTFAREGDTPVGDALVVESLRARDEGGGRTPWALSLRRFFDLPVNDREAPSP